MIPRQSMLIELPIAVLKGSSNKDLANKFIQFVKATGRAGSVRAVRLASGQPDGREEVRVEVPGAARHLQDRRQDHRRLAAADERWFDLNKGLHGGIERAIGGPTTG